MDNDKRMSRRDFFRFVGTSGAMAVGAGLLGSCAGTSSETLASPTVAATPDNAALAAQIAQQATQIAELQTASAVNPNQTGAKDFTTPNPVNGNPDRTEVTSKQTATQATTAEGSPVAKDAATATPRPENKEVVQANLESPFHITKESDGIVVSFYVVVDADKHNEAPYLELLEFDKWKETGGQEKGPIGQMAETYVDIALTYAKAANNGLTDIQKTTLGERANWYYDASSGNTWTGSGEYTTLNIDNLKLGSSNGNITAQNAEAFVRDQEKRTNVDTFAFVADPKSFTPQDSVQSTALQKALDTGSMQAVVLVTVINDVKDKWTQRNSVLAKFLQLGVSNFPLVFAEGVIEGGELPVDEKQKTIDISQRLRNDLIGPQSVMTPVPQQ